MFCPNCGSEVNEGAKFCPACGGPMNVGSHAESAGFSPDQESDRQSDEIQPEQINAGQPSMPSAKTDHNERRHNNPTGPTGPFPGAQPPYGGQASYGGQQQYGAQPPYTAQQNYGAQSPYGTQPRYGTQQQYGGQPQYGAPQQSGMQYPKQKKSKKAAVILSITGGVLIIAVALILIFTLGGSSGPGATVNKFFDYFEKGEYQKMAELFDPDSSEYQDFFMDEEEIEAAREVYGNIHFKFDQKSVEMVDDTATVTGNLRIEADGELKSLLQYQGLDYSQDVEDFQVELIKIDGKWLISQLNEVW